AGASTNVEVADLAEAQQSGEGRLMRWLTTRYERVLQWSLRHARLILLASLVVVAGSALIFFQLGRDFLPGMDEGAFVLDYLMPPGTSLEETNRVLNHVESFLKDTSEVSNYSRRTGAQLGLFLTEPNSGDLLIRLKRDRERSSEDVISELRKKIEKAEPALKVEFVHILEDLIGDLEQAPEPIEIKVYHPDDKVYREVAHD